MPQYADVILPLPLYSVFTYSVPQEAMASLCVGMRVVVPVRNKFYTAIVERLHDEKPDFKVKPIASVVDEQPTVLQSQLQFWKWIALCLRSLNSKASRSSLQSLMLMFLP